MFLCIWFNSHMYYIWSQLWLLPGSTIPCGFLFLLPARADVCPRRAAALAGLESRALQRELGTGDSACNWLHASTSRAVRVTLSMNSPKGLDHLVFLLNFRSAACQEFMQCIILEQRPLQPFPSTQVIPTAMLKKYENKQCEGLLSHWNKNIILVEWEKRMFYWSSIKSRTQTPEWNSPFQTNAYFNIGQIV